MISSTKFGTPSTTNPIAGTNNKTSPPSDGAKHGLILVTGGTGYIGSHCCVELLQSGWDVIIIDNLCNSTADVIPVIEQLGGRAIRAFHQIDLCDRPALEQIFAQYQGDLPSSTSLITTIIHFAGLKAVGESGRDPLRYYENNLVSSINLLQLMGKYRVGQLIYSSSATVYGDPSILPIPEEAPLNPTSPYGYTKLWIEQIVMDGIRQYCGRGIILRYFNPVGAHPSGQMGENPRGTPNNLMPYLSRVVQGQLPYLPVYGADYPTPDGTGIRDYIHVVDLVLGHVAALNHLPQLNSGTTEIYNLGTGRGYSVMEMIQAFCKVVGQPIPYMIQGRRPGDVAQVIADATRARCQLHWNAERDLNKMCRDLWEWTKKHPNGSKHHLHELNLTNEMETRAPHPHNDQV